MKENHDMSVSQRLRERILAGERKTTSEWSQEFYGTPDKAHLVGSRVSAMSYAVDPTYIKQENSILRPMTEMEIQERRLKHSRGSQKVLKKVATATDTGMEIMCRRLSALEKVLPKGADAETISIVISNLDNLIVTLLNRS